MLTNEFMIKHKENVRNLMEGMDAHNHNKITFNAMYELFDEWQRTQGAAN